MSQDPWKHRSEGMKCKTCMWNVAKMGDAGRPALLGRCRKHAPTMNGYPAVFPDDWCGDHKLDENKLQPVPEFTPGTMYPIGMKPGDPCLKGFGKGEGGAQKSEGIEG